jgi:diguanylate cyclase (GGDEF)-like protein
LTATTNAVEPTGRRILPGRASVFIVATGLMAVALCMWTALGPRSAPRELLPWPFIALAMIAAQLLPVRLHTRRQTMSVDLFDLPMLLGAALTWPSGLLMAAFVAGVFGTLRRRDPLPRALFNIAIQVVGVDLARTVLTGVLSNGALLSPRGWAALCLALVTYDGVTTVAVLVAISLTAGLSRRDVEGVALHLVLVLPINAVLGIVAVTMAWTSRWSLLLLGGAGLGLGLWYRTATALRGRYANLQLLYDFTVTLTDISDEDELVEVALTEVRRLLRCNETEMLAPGADNTRYWLDDEGRLRTEKMELSDVDKQVLSRSEPVLIPRSGRGIPVGRGFTDLMAVPIQLGGLGTGVLLAADRDGEGVTFDAEDLRLFEALAAHLSTALTSSRRLDRLRHEVAARGHEATHDSLTGLANRTMFNQWTAEALRTRQPSQLTAVMLMDLDGFKEINDTLGHSTGDDLLIETAQRVLSTVGSRGMAARLGGDEFAIVLPQAANRDDVMAIGETLLNAISRPITHDGLMLVLRASLGIALAPLDGLDESTLLKRADVAMYAAKGTSRGVAAYDPEDDHNTTRRLILATELQRAATANELEVWYQPTANLQDGKVTGVEALLRWNHREFGSISPTEFIPVAEQTGVIQQLTWWVMRTALEELRNFSAKGYELTVAVNVSARSFLDAEFVERLCRLLDELGVSARGLVLEITESSVMLDADRSEGILRSLAELGVTIAIDDFGTGYSSLSRLRNLPVHTVKVDRSFVTDLCTSSGDEAIVRTTVELARNLGHTVIAEGVEDKATWDRLRALGCDEAQGYYLSRAVPIEAFHSWLGAYQRPQMASVHTLSIARGA